jgi:hypothetical protein
MRLKSEKDDGRNTVYLAWFAVIPATDVAIGNRRMERDDQEKQARTQVVDVIEPSGG